MTDQTKIDTLVYEANRIADGEILSFSVDGCLPFEKLFSAFKDDGWVDLERFETNGWQIDWWAHFQKGNFTLCLSGGCYYGGIQLFEDGC